MTMHRHWDTFRAALAAERSHAPGPDRGDAADFLPAILEITEKPPSPFARHLLWLLCALVIVILLWAAIGKIDIVAIGRGRIVPQEEVKTIQWGGGGTGEGLYGVVRAIHVQEGQAVHRGQLLVELDPTVSGAEATQAAGGLADAELSRARGEAFARFLAGRSPNFTPPAGTPPEVASTQASLVTSIIGDYQAKSADLSSQKLQREAEADAASTDFAKLQETLPLYERQLDARRELAAKGYVSKLLLLQVEALLVEKRKELDVQRSALAKARAALAEIATQQAQLRAELAKQSFGDLATAERDVALRTAESAKAASRAALAHVTAPVDGIVTGLTVHTLGGVIQTGQTLMTIVPEGARLIVSARVPNQDVGFLRQGQAVTVKLDAFPFTTYGTIGGTLVSVSADAAPPMDQATAAAAQGARAAAPAADMLAYTVRVALDPQAVQHVLTRAGCPDSGRCARKIIPGMAASAEIRTGRRSILAYLLDPVMGAASEAGRER